MQRLFQLSEPHTLQLTRTLTQHEWKASQRGVMHFCALGKRKIGKITSFAHSAQWSKGKIGKYSKNNNRAKKKVMQQDRQATTRERETTSGSDRERERERREEQRVSLCFGRGWQSNCNTRMNAKIQLFSVIIIFATSKRLECVFQHCRPPTHFMQSEQKRKKNLQPRAINWERSLGYSSPWWAPMPAPATSAPLRQLLQPCHLDWLVHCLANWGDVADKVLQNVSVVAGTAPLWKLCSQKATAKIKLTFSSNGNWVIFSCKTLLFWVSLLLLLLLALLHPL